MNCIEFRRLRLSDPYATDDELTKHQDDCQLCYQFETDLLLLDKKVQRALMVDVPEGLSARILLNQSLGRANRRPLIFRWTSLAASVVLVIMLSMLQFPAKDSFQSQLVSHVKDEHIVFPSSIEAIDDALVKKVLSSINLQSAASLGKVVFAQNCNLDGDMVGHIVIERNSVNYTLLIVPGESGEVPAYFNEDEWYGVATSHVSGSRVAVLSNDRKSADTNEMISILAELTQTIHALEA